MKSSFRSTKGFTLLEILLVVALISILAGIVIIAINPSKQIADAQNAGRKVDVNTILNAMYQYAIDNVGMFPGPGTIPTAPAAALEICKTGAPSCAGLIDLSGLTSSGKYIPSFPVDSAAANPNGTGYAIQKTSAGRLTVSALNAAGITISVTR